MSGLSKSISEVCELFPVLTGPREQRERLEGSVLDIQAKDLREYDNG
jgi:hypothetical protein